MTISAKPILRSEFRNSDPLITLQLRYPRFIHAECKTHRLLRIDDVDIDFMEEISLMDDENLSRNASSSRAVPVMRLIEEALNDPAMPSRFGSAKAGMQDGGDHHNPVYLTTFEQGLNSPGVFYGTEFGFTPDQAWLYARDRAVEVAKAFLRAGYHKQVINRLLEPFTHISVVVTATEWGNFLRLRDHEAADPSMRALAVQVRRALEESERPEYRSYGGWHLPYVRDEEDYALARRSGWDFPELAKLSAARCARVSYLNHDGSDPVWEKDMQLAGTLLALRHMSPFEHQAYAPYGTMKPELFGNLVGWHQYRRVIETGAISPTREMFNGVEVLSR